MAHADYNCCAVCDNKMDYNAWDAKTKEEICIPCLEDLHARGVMVYTGDALIQWINDNEPGHVQAILTDCGFSTCLYRNRVDKAFVQRTGSTQGRAPDGMYHQDNDHFDDEDAS